MNNFYRYIKNRIYNCYVLKKIKMINSLYYLIVYAIVSITLYCPQVSADNKFASMELKGTVNPIIAEHIVNSINKANNHKVQFTVIKMDTPGGLLSSTREIIKAILSSIVPVVVYTYPKGAQAASAGGYIMLSADIAAMAPGTEIGAMHPVSPFLNSGGKSGKESSQSGIMKKKVLNDLIAYARSLAQKKNRNVDWAEKAVKDAISSTYSEAKSLGVIDIIAEDMNDLLVKLDGRRVDMNGKVFLLNTKNITEITYNMDWKSKIFNFFADPQVIFVLIIITILGIGIEVKNPGMVVPGAVGTAAFFIFLMAIKVLPINFSGILLIIAAIILFILELKIISYGLLTMGGIISFIAGSLILFDSPLPGLQIPISSIIGVIIFLLFFFFIVARSVLIVHKGKISTGVQGLLGKSGTAVADFDKKGKIMIHGEIWNAHADEKISKDETVVVMSVEGMMLFVKKKA